MAVGDQVCGLEPFISSVVPSDDTTARDVELLKREVEAYLTRLLAAICAELQQIRDDCCPSGLSP